MIGSRTIVQRVSRRSAVVLLALSPGLVMPAGAAEAPREVVVGPDYDASGIHRFWFGNGYRAEWTTPVTLEVLDLDAEAGGLTPLMQVGGMQTPGLAFKGADGRSYTFRSLDKEPQRILPPAWRDTAPAKLFKDQTSASHPGAAPVFAALAEAAGILFPPTRLMVMPDVPTLAQFRQSFAGKVGTFSEFPTPGFGGATEIASSEELWSRWLEGPEGRVDGRVFLKARLLDMVTGNWDRHRNQWRWARIPGEPLWQPVPEDPDQCFARYEGAALAYVRLVEPKMMRYDGPYPGRIEGLTYNSADVNRWLLADLEREDFEPVARELQEQLTDAVIEGALRQMPPEWYALSGADLATALEQRRDGLADFAQRFYRHLADRVDVRASGGDDVARVHRAADGSLELTLATTDGAPYYRRTFLPDETEEVRLYLLPGADRLETTGRAGGPIKLRVMGGPGDDVLDDSRSGGTELRDHEGNNRFERGRGTKVIERPWSNPEPLPGGPWMEPRGHGRWTAPTVVLWWDPDVRALVGVGFNRTSWGFRKYPWATLQTASLSYSTGEKKFKFDYSGQRRLTERGLLARADLLASGIEHVNHFGFGNETPETDDSLSETRQDQFSFFPSLRLERGSQFEAFLGAQAKWVRDPADADNILSRTQPYGAGEFGELLVRGGFEVDSRGRSVGLAGLRMSQVAAEEQKRRDSGVRLEAGGFVAPTLWDVESTFGGVEGSLSGYLGNDKALLALRVGGRQVWGEYPWFEAATVGGSSTVRGYDSQRFAGESALYGNAELRFWLGRRKTPILPLRWGLVLLADSGRVWFEGESSDKWHSAYGLGAMVQLIGTPLIFTGGVAKGDEGLGFYFKYGYSF